MADGVTKRSFPSVPKVMPNGLLNQASPVSGTLYAVLSGYRIRIIGLIVKVTWTVQPSPLDVYITADGVVYHFTQANPVSATPYKPVIDLAVDEANQLMSATTLQNLPFLIEGRSVTVDAKTTGGTVSALVCRVHYGKW